jgi:hypothetical protein
MENEKQWKNGLLTPHPKRTSIEVSKWEIDLLKIKFSHFNKKNLDHKWEDFSIWLD